MIQSCPVCSGCGTVPHDFYTRFGSSTSTSRVTCRSCWGRGVIDDQARIAELEAALNRAADQLDRCPSGWDAQSHAFNVAAILRAALSPPEDKT